MCVRLCGSQRVCIYICVCVRNLPLPLCVFFHMLVFIIHIIHTFVLGLANVFLAVFEKKLTALPLYFGGSRRLFLRLCSFLCFPYACVGVRQTDTYTFMGMYAVRHANYVYITDVHIYETDALALCAYAVIHNSEFSGLQ